MIKQKMKHEYFVVLSFHFQSHELLRQSFALILFFGSNASIGNKNYSVYFAINGSYP